MRWLVLPFWLVIVGAGIAMLLFGFPSRYSIPIGSVTIAGAVLCLANYGFYSIFCIRESKIIYRDWFGVVQHEVPLSELRSVENVKSRGSRGHTWLLVLKWNGGQIGLNRSYYRRAEIGNVVRAIVAHAPSARMPPSVLNLTKLTADG